MLSVFSLLACVIIGSEDIDGMLLGSPLFSVLLVIIVIIEETYCFHGRHPSGSQSSRRSFPLQQPLHLSGAHKDMIIIPISSIIQYPIDIWHRRQTASSSPIFQIWLPLPSSPTFQSTHRCRHLMMNQNLF